MRAQRACQNAVYTANQQNCAADPKGTDGVASQRSFHFEDRAYGVRGTAPQQKSKESAKNKVDGEIDAQGVLEALAVAFSAIHGSVLDRGIAEAGTDQVRARHRSACQHPQSKLQQPEVVKQKGCCQQHGEWQGDILRCTIQRVAHAGLGLR